MAQVELQCGPHRVVSLMSSEAVRELGLEPGSLAVAVVKSTNVIVETAPGGAREPPPTSRPRLTAALLRSLTAAARPCLVGDDGGSDERTITVFAAASLTGDLHRARRRSSRSGHPGVEGHA